MIIAVGLVGPFTSSESSREANVLRGKVPELGAESLRSQARWEVRLIGNTVHMINELRF